MATYLLTWNPERWPWGDIQNDLASIAQMGFCDSSWSTGVTRKIQPDDRVFMMKLGRLEPRGIMASGWAISEVYQDIHWADSAKRAWYVNVCFETILDPAQGPLFPVQSIRNGTYERVKWTPQASGMTIPDDVAEQLEKDWAKFFNRSVPVRPIERPDELDDAQTFPEGNTKQARINIHERNRRARVICINRYGPSCSVCGLDFGERYGEIGRGFIHVHHLKPLSAICEGYELNPIADLRPVCPNCHAMLHQKKPEPYTINQLKAILSRPIA